MGNYTMTDFSVLVAIGLMLLIVGALIVVINHICVMRQMRREHLYAMKENSLCNADSMAMMEYQVKLQRDKDMAVNNHMLKKVEGMYHRVMNDLPKQLVKATKDMMEEL